MTMCPKIIFHVFLTGIIFNAQAWKHNEDKQTKLPKFMWLPEEKSNYGIPFLNIRFPDGGKDDYAILRQIQTEAGTGTDCEFEGHLNFEPDVVVNITGGCAMSTSFQIKFKSKRLPFTLFQVASGKVKAVLEDLPSDTESSQNQLVHSTDNLGSCHPTQLPQNGFLLKIKAFYDQSFKMKFGEASVTIIELIMKNSQPLFNLPSLTTNLKLELVGIEELDNSVNANDNDLDLMATRYISPNTSIDAFVFFADTQDDDDEQENGFSYSEEGICSSNPKSKAIIVGWSQSLTTTAKTVAHEIGHLLGMEHDFLSINKTHYNRYDIAHKKCSSINGIMDYNSERTIWSTCSVRDFTDYFIKVVKGSRNMKFCLTPLEGVWSDWESFSSCSASCGGGTLNLQRSCTTLHQALTCSGLSHMEIRCNTQVCPIDGNWSAWSSLSSCSVTCGVGKQYQRRQCDNPAPKNGGQYCVGEDTLTTSCVKSCPNVYSKVLVALGYNSNKAIADVEIIDLLSSETTCKKPQNFKYINTYATGGLGFQDKPLICGGEYENRAACHLYEDGAWKSLDFLKQGRAYFAMTKSPFEDGLSKLFLTGGRGESNEFLGSSEVLTKNGWQKSVPLPVEIYAHCMVTVNSTSVMIIGGEQNGQRSGRSFLFNSKTNIWTEGPTLNIARSWHSCGSLRKNNQTEYKSLIAVGGNNKFSSCNSVEILDFDSNEWRRGPDLPFSIANAAMVEDPSGGVVLIGKDTLYRLPHAGSDATWELMKQKLKTKREGHTAFLIPDEIAACN